MMSRSSVRGPSVHPAHAPLIAFYRPGMVEQLFGRQQGIQRHHRVKKVRLVLRPQRLGAVKRRTGDQPGAREMLQRLQCGFNLLQRLRQLLPSAI